MNQTHSFLDFLELIPPWNSKTHFLFVLCNFFFIYFCLGMLIEWMKPPFPSIHPSRTLLSGFLQVLHGSPWYRPMGCVPFTSLFIVPSSLYAEEVLHSFFSNDYTNGKRNAFCKLVILSSWQYFPNCEIPESENLVSKVKIMFRSIIVSSLR